MTSKWVGGGEAAHVRCCPSCTALPPHSASSPVTPLCLAATRRWSAVSRAERYRKRLQENGEDTSLLGAQHGGRGASLLVALPASAAAHAALSPAIIIRGHNPHPHPHVGLCTRSRCLFSPHLPPPPPRPADQDNPLPHFVDPITMSVVVRPAISPYGHVAGLATWKVGRAAARPSGCAARAVVLPWLAVGLGMLSVCRVHNRATPPRQCSLG
jgi:hypothetical protein